jgi:hypothetical protein
MAEDIVSSSTDQAQIARIFSLASESRARACLMSVDEYRRDAHELQEHAERWRQVGALGHKSDSCARLDRIAARALGEIRSGEQHAGVQCGGTALAIGGSKARA